MTMGLFRVIFTGVVAALAAAPMLAWLMRRAGLFDMPGSEPHKRHVKPVVIAGGGALLAVVGLVSWGNGLFDSPVVRAILVGAGTVFVFGLWDDARNLPPWGKLLGQMFAAGVLIRLGVQVWLFNVQWVNWALTLLWVVGVTNAYNFVDSMDGLATGLAGLAAAFFMLVTFDAGQERPAVFSAALLGACIGVYFYNASPAHVFLGDSGAQWLGFTLAALAIAYNPVGFLRSQSWFVPILLTGVPLFDAALVVYSRLRRKTPVYQANVDHTYHRLVQRGMDNNRAVLLMHITALSLGCLAFITLSLPPGWANLVYFGCIAAAAAAILYLDNTP